MLLLTMKCHMCYTIQIKREATITYSCYENTFLKHKQFYL